MKKNKFSKAFKVFVGAFRKDKDLFRAYKDNIAVCFQDAMVNNGYRFPDLHRISNEGALNFLNLLLVKSAKHNGRVHNRQQTYQDIEEEAMSRKMREA